MKEGTPFVVSELLLYANHKKNISQIMIVSFSFSTIQSIKKSFAFLTLANCSFKNSKSNCVVHNLCFECLRLTSVKCDNLQICSANCVHFGTEFC